MAKRSCTRQYEPRDLVAEIVRRAGSGQVLHVSDPPTPRQQLQLLAARLERRAVAIMPVVCRTMDEWLARYAAPKAGLNPDSGPRLPAVSI
jgi:hypothetical protein